MTIQTKPGQPGNGPGRTGEINRWKNDNGNTN